MASETQLARLAAMASALRPDWNPQSTLTILKSQDLVGRAWRDLAVALAWLACDERTQTPARLRENGPWWLVTRDVASHPQPPAFAPPSPLTPAEREAAARAAAETKAALAAAKDAKVEADKARREAIEAATGAAK